MMLGGSSLQQTRDSIGSNPQILPIPIITPDAIQVWQEPMLAVQVDPGNSFILGSTVNGVLGVALGSNGEQILLGNYSDVIVGSIVSSSLRYYNFLRDTPANQTAYGVVASLTTATIDTSSFEIDFSSGEDVVWRCHNSGDRITAALVFLDTDSSRTNMDFGVDTFIYVSANSGVDWTLVPNGLKTTLSVPGDSVWLKITCTNTSGFWKTRNSEGYDVPIKMVLS
jgi:hypothetical protein